MITDLGAFLALSALLAIIPGPDTAVTVRSALVGDATWDSLDA
mgnify:CR=1 FL=1